MIEPTKVCTKCGVEYPATREFFVNNKNCKNGIEGSCKKCALLDNRKWRSKNPEKVKAYRKKRYDENPERVKELVKKYAFENHEKVKIRQKKWRSKNPEKVNAIIKKWREKNPEKYAYLYTKRNIKKTIGATPPPELVEIKVLINKTKKLCKTLNS